MCMQSSSKYIPDAFSFLFFLGFPNNSPLIWHYMFFGIMMYMYLQPWISFFFLYSRKKILPIPRLPFFINNVENKCMGSNITIILWLINNNGRYLVIKYIWNACQSFETHFPIAFILFENTLVIYILCHT